MTITLVAIKADEGKAFIKKDTQYIYLKPPLYEFYLTDMLCDEMEMKRIMAREGYQMKNIQFPSVPKVVEHILSEYETAKTTGLRSPRRETLEKLVKETDDNILIEYIDKAIYEWLPENNIAGAKELLKDLQPRQGLSNRLGKLESEIRKYEHPVATELVIDVVYIKSRLPAFTLFYQKYKVNSVGILKCLDERRTVPTPFQFADSIN